MQNENAHNTAPVGKASFSPDFSDTIADLQKPLGQNDIEGSYLDEGGAPHVGFTYGAFDFSVFFTFH